MNTLTTAPLAPLLDRLFKEAAAASPATTPSVAGRAWSVARPNTWSSTGE
jgi:hypothetical protein